MENEQHTVSGLLRKREQLQQENATLRERMASIANDIEAIDRVLDAFGHHEPLEGRTARAARIILFYRNELREFLQKELAKAGKPLSTRELAIILCETEGKATSDRRMLSDVARRASKCLREMRHIGIVESIPRRGAYLWALARKQQQCVSSESPADGAITQTR